jgi:hypothetical protein
MEMQRAVITLIKQWQRLVGWTDREFDLRMGIRHEAEKERQKEEKNRCTLWLSEEYDIAFYKLIALILCIGTHLYRTNEGQYRLFKSQVLAEGAERMEVYLQHLLAPRADGHAPVRASPSARPSKGMRPSADAHRPNQAEGQDTSMPQSLIIEAKNKVMRLSRKQEAHRRERQRTYEYLCFDVIDCLTSEPTPDERYDNFQ